jgi:hypothetical protein
MCLLNGDVGGLLPSSTRFDMMDTQLPSGEWIEQKVLIYNIILEKNHNPHRILQMIETILTLVKRP